jgi:hypothetical protein
MDDPKGREGRFFRLRGLTAKGAGLPQRRRSRLDRLDPVALTAVMVMGALVAAGAFLIVVGPGDVGLQPYADSSPAAQQPKVERTNRATGSTTGSRSVALTAITTRGLAATTGLPPGGPGRSSLGTTANLNASPAGAPLSPPFSDPGSPTGGGGVGSPTGGGGVGSPTGGGGVGSPTGGGGVGSPTGGGGVGSPIGGSGGTPTGGGGVGSPIGGGGGPPTGGGGVGSPTGGGGGPPTGGGPLLPIGLPPLSLPPLGLPSF